MNTSYRLAIEFGAASLARRERREDPTATEQQVENGRRDPASASEPVPAGR